MKRGRRGGELEGKKAGPEIEAARASAVALIKETVRSATRCGRFSSLPVPGYLSHAI